MACDIPCAVAFLRRRIGDVPIFLVGESMGGALAVRAAGEGMLGDDVAGLVLVAPGALACNLRRVAYALFARILRGLGARAEVFVQRIRAGELSADAAIRLLADPLVLRRISPGIFSGLLNVAIKAVDTAPNVRIPSLTLVGTREDVSPLACVRKLHARLGGEAEWAEFNGGPHMLLHWQECGPVLARIFQWLDARVASRETQEDRLSRPIALNQSSRRLGPATKTAA
jgi:pimeloyl-ACP methyl ester carboxylesterase